MAHSSRGPGVGAVTISGSGPGAGASTATEVVAFFWKSHQQASADCGAATPSSMAAERLRPRGRLNSFITGISMTGRTSATSLLGGPPKLGVPGVLQRSSLSAGRKAERATAVPEVSLVNKRYFCSKTAELEEMRLRREQTGVSA